MSYGYDRTITIPAGKFPSDQVNISIPFAGTNASFASVANGGRLINAPFDIAWFADLAHTVPLKFERHLLDPTTGQYAFTVKLPTASASVATVIHIGYGDASVTTDQQDAANAYDANYKAVLNGGDGTTLSLLDSTANGNDLTNFGATAAAGLIGGAFSLNGASSYLERVAIFPAAAPVTAVPLTIEILFKPAASVGVAQVPVGMNLTAGAGSGFNIQVRATDVVRAQTGSGTAPQTANGAISSAAWNYACAVFIATNNRRLLVNGAAAVSDTSSPASTVVPDNISVGVSANTSSHSLFYNGLIDQIRISNVARSDDWATAMYNATVGIATFYTLGGETQLGTGSTAITTQPPASVTGGVVMATVVAKATTDGSAVDPTFTGNAVASWVGPFGSLGGTTTVACVAGVATFNNLIPTGEGEGFSLTISMSGYTTAASTSFTVVGPKMTRTLAWIAGTGGNTKHLYINDARYSIDVVSGHAATMRDAIGTYGGRTPGPTVSQATAGLRPTVNGTLGVDSYLSFNGTQWMASALHAAYTLFADATTANPLWLWAVCRADAPGPIMGLVRDEAARTNPFMVNRPAGTTWGADISTDGSAVTNPPLQAGTALPDSGLPFGDDKLRLVMLGKMGYYPNASASANIQHVYILIVAAVDTGATEPATGTPIARHGRFMDPPTGANKLVYGKHSTAFGQFDLMMSGVYAGEMTNLIRIAHDAFLAGQFT